MAGNTPTAVVDGTVWLGPAPVSQSGNAFDTSDSSHVAVLKTIGITHIVNCTPDVPFITRSQLGLEQGRAGEDDEFQFRVPVPDVDGAAVALGSYLDSAITFMADAIRSGGKIYVHCETGKSRSATVVLAYRVSRLNESLRDAYTDTKTKRPYIQPKPAFFNLLVSRELEWLSAGGAGAGAGVGAASECSSYTTQEYATVYLLDHFEPYLWVDGISEEAIRAAVASDDSTPPIHGLHCIHFGGLVFFFF